MKKLKALLAVLCIVFAACAVMACGSEDSESAKTVVNAPVINSKVITAKSRRRPLKQATLTPLSKITAA